MMRFSQFLTEAKNLHMEHLEDSVINNGSRGVAQAIRFVESVKKMLRGGKAKVTVKWDGAPAVFCGTDPKNGKFFVATKALFNATPKVNYTEADIRANHAGGLVDILTIALRELKKLGIKNVVQGDIMFIKSHLKTQSVDGESCYTFQPNTIVYAVPVNSELGTKIGAAQIGVIFHTNYSGASLSTLSAKFGVDVGRFSKTSSVWFDDAYLKNADGVLLTDKQEGSIDSAVENCNALVATYGTGIDRLISHSFYESELKIYINANVRTGLLNLSASGFAAYIKAKLQKNIDNIKKDENKKAKTTQMNSVLRDISNNKSTINGLFDIHAVLTKMKLILIRKMQQIHSIGTFIRTEDGLEATNPEGYVAINSAGTVALKLVNRLEFSKNNFTVAKNWVAG